MTDFKIGDVVEYIGNNGSAFLSEGSRGRIANVYGPDNHILCIESFSRDEQVFVVSSSLRKVKGPEKPQEEISMQPGETDISSDKTAPKKIDWTKPIQTRGRREMHPKKLEAVARIFAKCHWEAAQAGWPDEREAFVDNHWQSFANYAQDAILATSSHSKECF